MHVKEPTSLLAKEQGEIPVKWSNSQTYRQARSHGGGGGGAVGAVAPRKKCHKKKGEREKKKENKVACMHVKLPPFNHFQSNIRAIRGKYRAYAPNCTINNIKMQKALTVGGGHPLPPKIKLWLCHCIQKRMNDVDPSSFTLEGYITVCSLRIT